MKFVERILCIVALFAVSCTSKAKQNDVKNTSETTKNAKADTSRFFQVTDFVKSQIAEVNRTPYFIYKIVKTQSGRDSSVINTTIFNQISTNFLTSDINNTVLKNQYKESIFHDQTTKSFTISYTTNNKNLPVQNIDILLKEDGQTVKRIFIRKFFNYSDSSVIEQLSWKPNESFEINRMIQKVGSEKIVQTRVVWNEKS